MILSMAGLPGSGKSTIARGLARRLAAVVVSKDEIRSNLFRAEEIDYSREQDAVCFQQMLQVTEHVLAGSPGSWVILDGRTFSRAADMLEVMSLAERLRQSLYVIECFCSDDEARKRLETDCEQGSHPAANRDYRLYLEIKSHQEPLPVPALRLDTGLELETCLRQCLDYLMGARP